MTALLMQLISTCWQTRHAWIELSLDGRPGKGFQMTAKAVLKMPRYSSDRLECDVPPAYTSAFHCIKRCLERRMDIAC